MQNSESLTPPVPPVAGLIVGVLAASTASILIRFAQVEAPSLVIAAYRLSLASLALAPPVLIRHTHELRRMTLRQIALSLVAGVFLAIHFATWISSLRYTTVASSAVLVATSPLFVALLSPLALRETPSRALVLGLLLSLSGSLIIGFGDACTSSDGFRCPPLSQFLDGQAIRGDFLAMAGAIAGAGYMIVGRGLRGRLSLIPYIGLVYTAAALTLDLMVWGSDLPIFGYSPRTYLWFALLALLPQLVAHSTVNWALRYLSASFVAVTMLGEPVATTLWAFLILAETPPSIGLIGGVVILFGITVAAQGRTSSGPQP